MSLPRYLASPEAYDEFLAQFAAGTFPIAEWTHAAHVAMAAGYHIQHGERALDEVRRAIRFYNESQGGANTATSGYHETLTVFWLTLVARAVDALPRGTSPLEAARAALAQLGTSSGLFREYYSYDVIKNQEARARYLPPDLRPL